MFVMLLRIGVDVSDVDVVVLVAAGAHGSLVATR
jgi:hypothetical protein